MNYAKIVNGQISYAPYEVSKNGMSIVGYNFDGNAEMMIADGYKPVELIKDKSSYVDCEGTFTFEFEEREDKIVEEAVFHEYTVEEKAERLRQRRDNGLTVTDKYMIADYPISDSMREKYRQYRQYLRDLPDDANFPNVSLKSFEEWENDIY